MESPAEFVRSYLDRVVNRRDLSAVDELVDPHFRGDGFGWPPDRDALRRFYAWQAQSRPDWHITVQEAVELGNVVVLRASAGGTVSHDERGTLLDQAYAKRLEWLAAFRVEAGRLLETRVLELRELPADQVAGSGSQA